jgi:glycosyltransferase involved in cell wall biosynthesis
MPPAPRASILIDTYNHERFLEKAIESVLGQDALTADMEVLVVDDGSADGTRDIVRKFSPRVRYLRKSNGGQASAFNAGVPELHGDVCLFLDGDDWWLPGKLRKVLEAFDGNPDIVGVGHGIVEMHLDGRSRTVSRETPTRVSLRDRQAAHEFVPARCYLGTSRLSLRRDALEKILPAPEPLVFEADEWLWSIAVALGDVLVLGEPLTAYRIHGGNLYQSARVDLAALRRRQSVMAALLATLPPRLAELGVGRDSIEVVLDSIRVDEARTRLSIGGGTRRETFEIERKAYALRDGRSTPWREMILRLALVLPPRHFYRLQRWYGQRVDAAAIRRS